MNEEPGEDMIDEADGDEYVASGEVPLALFVGGNILDVDVADEVGIEELEGGLVRPGYNACCCFCAGEGDVAEFSDNWLASSESEGVGENAEDVVLFAEDPLGCCCVAFMVRGTVVVRNPSRSKPFC